MAKLTKGTRVEFTYHGRTRTGTVESCGLTHVTLEHDDAELFDGKQFSSYLFKKIQGTIRVIA